jgi:hypothetical protein
MACKVFPQDVAQAGPLAAGSAGMSGKVTAAIAAVAGEVTRLAKGEKNQHGRYNYASIDDFLSMTGPLCAKHGLIILQDEKEFEVRGDWLLMRFEFTLAHAPSGEVMDTRPQRSILVNAKMGSQAFGAAQSYVLKQFLRSLLQISTGENEDIDAHKAVTLPKNVADPRGDLSGVEPADVEKYVKKFADALAADEDEYGHADRIRAIHDDLRGKNELYIAVADRLAKEKILSKAELRAFINLKRDAA